jgi:adenylosuccinate synthase
VKQVVIGLGFGDEGKGLVTDWLCSKDPKSSVVTRYSGGHQAGHCVTIEDKKHIFTNFGSGSLRGVPTNWEAKTFDPVSFISELTKLNEKNVYPVIYVNPKCPITTPFEKSRNHKREKINNHGSVGVGFSDTLRREEANYHLYFSDLYYPKVFNMKMNLIMDYYEKNDIFISEEEYFEFIEACKSVIFKVRNEKIEGIVQIYESSQGLLLDRDYGFFPYCTYGRVGTQEIDIGKEDEFYLVTRAYQTRHGEGPNSGIGFKPNNFNETNVYNDYQKDFRTSVLDFDMLLYSINVDEKIRKSYNKNLVITCMDQMPYFSLIHNNEEKMFETERDFLNYIISKLPKMNEVFVSYGPKAKDIVSADIVLI